MLPKSGLACLFLLSLLGVLAPAQATIATTYGESDISRIETKIFAHPYQSEALPKRMVRLERFVYGNEQNGALQERMNHLFGTLSSKDLHDKPLVVAQNLEKKSIMAPVNTAKVSQQNTKYPRVTEIEKQILDQSFEIDTVNSRLSRLEEKVFGRSWIDGDLATRTDRLAEYAYMSPKVVELERQEFLRVSMLSRPSVRTIQAKRAVSVVDEIESLETMAFGKISASKPLARRVDALEISFCGASRSDTQQDITARVAMLMSKVGVTPNRLGV